MLKHCLNKICLNNILLIGNCRWLYLFSMLLLILAACATPSDPCFNIADFRCHGSSVPNSHMSQIDCANLFQRSKHVWLNAV